MQQWLCQPSQRCSGNVVSPLRRKAGRNEDLLQDLGARFRECEWCLQGAGSEQTKGGSSPFSMELSCGTPCCEFAVVKRASAWEETH